MASKPFTAVVVGTGFIGPVHAEALLRVGVRVASLIGSSPEASRNASAKLGLAGAHESFHEALADADVDAVHIATPNHLHASQVEAALEAGKHVLCEKPLTPTAAESERLVRLARSRGLAAGVAYNVRFYPLCLEAAARVRSGGFGELFHAHGSYTQDWLFHDTDFNWRVTPEIGGELRAAADIGTHWFDLVQHITGSRIVAVCADLRTVHPVRRRSLEPSETYSQTQTAETQSGGEAREAIDITTDDCGAVMLRFDSGANGCLWVSQTTAGRKNSIRFELAGSKEALAWQSESPERLWVGHRDRANETLTRDPALMSESAAAYAAYPGGHVEGYADTFKQLFRAFYGSIQRGDYATAPPCPTFADGLHEARLCEAVLQSHRERRWVDVPTDEEAPS